MEQAKGLSRIMLGVVDCDVTSPGHFEQLWQRVEKEQLEVEDISAAGVKDVDVGDMPSVVGGRSMVCQVRRRSSTSRPPRLTAPTTNCS